MYQRYILCSNRRESEDQCKGDPSSLSLPSILCHICGTKPSIKPLTTDRFEKPLSFSFVRVFSALYRKNQSRNSYCFLDLAARKFPAHKHTFWYYYEWCFYNENKLCLFCFNCISSTDILQTADQYNLKRIGIFPGLIKYGFGFCGN